MLEFSSSPQVKHSTASWVSNEVHFPAMFEWSRHAIFVIFTEVFECAVIFERKRGNCEATKWNVVKEIAQVHLRMLSVLQCGVLGACACR